MNNRNSLDLLSKKHSVNFTIQNFLSREEKKQNTFIETKLEKWLVQNFRHFLTSFFLTSHDLSDGSQC